MSSLLDWVHDGKGSNERRRSKANVSQLQMVLHWCYAYEGLSSPELCLWNTMSG